MDSPEWDGDYVNLVDLNGWAVGEISCLGSRLLIFIRLMEMEGLQFFTDLDLLHMWSVTKKLQRCD